ncbi:MAG: 4Fe-4S dicluster domain-containing protein [Halobacteriota archaeon]
MRLGIFLCTCNHTINIDFKNIRKSLRKDKEVEVVERHDQLCQGGLDYIIDDLRRLEFDTVIVAACTEKRRTFERVTYGFGRDTFFLNLREHCGWVHGRKEATEKAKSMIKAAISYVTIKSALPEPKKIAVDVGYDVLVIGDEDRGAIEVAKSLSKLANVHLVAKHVREWCDNIAIHIGEVKGIRGNIGEFEVEIEKKIDVAKCISCGLCADACSKNAIRADAVYTIGEGCDECGDCIDVCPTGAIEFHNREVIHAGQILVIEKGWKGSTRFGIYTAADYEDALSKALELVSNLGNIEKEKFLELDLERCASGRSELIGCELCLPCPYEAITREGEKIAFSDVRCQGCGLCCALCPLSVPQLQEYPDHLIYSQIENLLSADLDPKVLLFADSELFEPLNAVGRKRTRYPALLPLFVPCIDLVSETHILSAFELGADGVILWGGENSHLEQSETAVKFANLALSAFGLGERALLISDGRCEAEEFAKETADFVRELSPSPIRSMKPAAEEIDFTKPKRDVLLRLIQNLHKKTKVYPTLIEENTQFPFADVAIDSKCTLCNACVNLCSTKALSKGEKKLNFVYGRCIACGLCERACPEEAITLERVLDFSRLVEKEGKTLVERELIACAGCGKLFMSRSAFERISELLKEREGEGEGKGKGELGVEEQLELLKYCEECRAPKAVEWMYRKTSAEGVS